MSTTRTLSTRVNEKVYNSLVDYANEEGETISQVLHQLVDERIQLTKEMKECDSLECSIESETEKTTTTTPTFSQKSKFEKELDYLQNENILEKVKQRMEIGFAEYIDQLKTEVKKLETKIDGKQNKPMPCFTEEDRINSSFDV